MAQPRRKTKALVGWREWIALPDLASVPLKAKIDTGARTSSLHAFNLKHHSREGEPWVDFEVHPVQRSRDHTSTVSLPVTAFKRVRSSSGHSERRPVIRTRMRIGRHDFDIDMTLTSRDAMGFRMLLGRSALRGRFWVDSSKSFLQLLPLDAAESEVSKT